jgi:hypothetical protein
MENEIPANCALINHVNIQSAVNQVFGRCREILGLLGDGESKGIKTKAVLK